MLLAVIALLPSFGYSWWSNCHSSWYYASCESCVNADCTWCLEKEICAPNECSGTELSKDDLGQCPPNTKTTAYDEMKGFRAMIHSNNAYERKAYMEPSGFTDRKSYEHFGPQDDGTSGYAYMGVDHDFNEIVVSFRGSSSAKQLINDLGSATLAPLTPEGIPSNILGGEYFIQLVDGLYPLMKEDFWALLNAYPSYSVLLTGHSLGGALATIWGLYAHYDSDLGSTFSPRVSLYTVAEPRAGGLDLGRLVDDLFIDSYRITSNKDPIIHLPPCDMGNNDGQIGWVCNEDDANFWHHSTEIWYPYGDWVPVSVDQYGLDGSDLVLCDYREGTREPQGEDPSCSISVNDHHYNVPDHWSYWSVLNNGICDKGFPFDTSYYDNPWSGDVVVSHSIVDRGRRRLLDSEVANAVNWTSAENAINDALDEIHGWNSVFHVTIEMLEWSDALDKLMLVAKLSTYNTTNTIEYLTSAAYLNHSTIDFASHVTQFKHSEVETVNILESSRYTDETSSDDDNNGVATALIVVFSLLFAAASLLVYYYYFWVKPKEMHVTHVRLNG